MGGALRRRRPGPCDWGTRVVGQPLETARANPTCRARRCAAHRDGPRPVLARGVPRPHPPVVPRRTHTREATRRVGGDAARLGLAPLGGDRASGPARGPTRRRRPHHGLLLVRSDARPRRRSRHGRGDLHPLSRPDRVRIGRCRRPHRARRSWRCGPSPSPPPGCGCSGPTSGRDGSTSAADGVPTAPASSGTGKPSWPPTSVT